MRISEDIHNYYEKLVLEHFNVLKIEDKYVGHYGGFFEKEFR